MEKYAGAWLKAIPSEPKLSIPSDKMVIALRLFLRIPLQRIEGVSHLQEEDR